VFDLERKGKNKISREMVIGSVVGTVEPKVMDLAKVPICYGRALRGAGEEAFRRDA